MKDLLKNIKAVLTLAIICIAIGLLIGYFVTPSKQITNTITVPDSMALKQKDKQYQKALTDQQNAFEKILSMQKHGVAQVVTSNPNPAPLQEIIIHDTVKVEGKPRDQKVFPYDLMYFIQATRNAISVTTINPYLKAIGKDYQKNYTFPREGENFRLAADITIKDEPTIKLIYDDSPFKWRGFRIGGAIGYPQDWYLYFKLRIEFYRIGFEPELRAYKSPLWVNIDYRF